MRERFYGKVPTETLNRVVFPFLGASNKDVVVGPAPGQDAAVLKIGEEYLVVSVDPITATAEDLGWLAIHISANDVAVSGARPRWFLSNILLPQGFQDEGLQSITRDLHDAAQPLDIAVVGGHTEWTPELETPVIAGTCIGTTKRYFTSSSARPGDSIILTKGVGIEGTFVLAGLLEEWLTAELGEETVSEAAALRDSISVVEEAMALTKCDGLTAMHDPTEGGLALGLHELAEASGVGFEITEDQIPILEPVDKVATLLDVDPFSLLSSGALVATVDSDYEENALRLLDPLGIQANVIGRLTDDPNRIVLRRDGTRQSLAKPSADEIWRFIGSTSS